MAATTSSEPPAPFACEVCLSASFKAKAGPGCAACPAFHGTHYHPFSEGPEGCDVLFVGDAPAAPRVFVRENDLNPKKRDEVHLTFQDDAGKVVQNAVRQLQERAEFSNLKVRYTYGVRCTVDNPGKQVTSACQTPLGAELGRIVKAREGRGIFGPLVVVAHGTAALKSLDLGSISQQDAAGRTFETSFRGVPLFVVPTMSLKAIATAVGKYSSVVSDLERAFKAARNESVRVHERDYLESVYRYPKTIAEVRDLIDEVLAYTGHEGTPPEAWATAFDTETNTLHPHRDGLQVVAVSIAWDRAKSCAIPLWHKDTPYDPAEAWEHVKRYLASPKPKVMHNGRYDLKVVWKIGFDINNIVWDTMLAEHVLEEDKKGQYSLKFLTKQFIPEYAGYEDQLHKILAKLEGEGQAESIEEDPTEGIVTLPEEVTAALARHELKDTFQVKALRNRAADIARRRDAPVRPAPELVGAVERLGLPRPYEKTWKKALKALAKRREELRGTLQLDPHDAEVLADVELVLSQENIAWEPDPTPEELAFVEDAKVLISAKESGWFKAVKPKESKKAKKEGGFEKIPLADLLFYAAVDTDCTRQLAVIQRRRMLGEDEQIARDRHETAVRVKYDRTVRGKFSVVKICDDPHPGITLTKQLYLPRARELAKMEYHGVAVDRAYLARSKKNLEIAKTNAQQQLHRLAGEDFNIASGRKLAYFLFDVGKGFLHPNVPALEEKLRANDKLAKGVKIVGDRVLYRVVSYTEKGELQTTEAVLKHLQALYDCPFSNLVLAYRKAAKARDTFLENADVLSKLDGRLHTNYNLAGTSTGRLSSNDLNMQNIPKGELGGVKCKRLFVPEDDSMVFVNADAKGAEVSVFSAYSKDRRLIQALLEGRDTHCYFASTVLDPAKVAAGKTGEQRRIALEKAGIDDEHAWSYDDFAARDALIASSDPALQKYGKRMKKHRDNIKRVVFGILYGAGPRKIADIAGIEPELAKTIIDLLFADFPTIPNFVEQTKWELRTFGFVETYDGRRRRFAIKNAPRSLLSQAERQAVNFLVQGTNSDIVLKVLTEFAQVLERDLKGRLLLTVHDSIGFQLPKKYVGQLKDLMQYYGTKRVAETCPWMPVPYRWDVEVGSSYGDVVPIDEWLEKNPVQAAPPELSSTFEGYTEEEMLDELRHIQDDVPRKPKA